MGNTRKSQAIPTSNGIGVSIICNGGYKRRLAFFNIKTEDVAMKKSLLLLVTISLGLVLSGCSESQTPQTPKSRGTSKADIPSMNSVSATPIKREQSFSKVMLGARLFQKNCAVCHGKQAEGAHNWRQRGADGKYPAPPLNGSGHTWHHPKKGLINTIKTGTLNIGGSMPAWQDKLSDEEIEAILAWVISRWPEDIYQRWASRELELRRSSQ